jgi:hypothetical protein
MMATSEAARDGEEQPSICLMPWTSRGSHGRLIYGKGQTEARHTALRPGPIVHDAGRTAARVSALAEIGDWRRGNAKLARKSG